MSVIQGFAPKCYVVMEIQDHRQIHEIQVDTIEMTHSGHEGTMHGVTIRGHHVRMETTDGQIDPHLTDSNPGNTFEHRLKIIEQALHRR